MIILQKEGIYETIPIDNEGGICGASLKIGDDDISMAIRAALGIEEHETIYPRWWRLVPPDKEIKLRITVERLDQGDADNVL